MPQYDSQPYWEKRYTREPGTFEWYQGYNGLKSLLHQHVPTSAHILQVGVGTSRLQEEMVRLGGYKSIVSIDYSPIAIELLRELHKGMPQLSYEVADCRNMPEFADGSFDFIIDKGTLDAILCGEGATENAKDMLTECHRVLRPGGTYLLVTYGDPLSRLQYMVDKAFPAWQDVQVYCIAKTERLLNGALSDADKPAMVPVVKGPYPYSNLDAMEALSKQEGVHFAYVLTKEPRHVHLAPGAAAAAADGAHVSR